MEKTKKSRVLVILLILSAVIVLSSSMLFACRSSEEPGGGDDVVRTRTGITAALQPAAPAAFAHDTTLAELVPYLSLVVNYSQGEPVAVTLTAAMLSIVGSSGLVEG